jgi:hypothetical protein
VRLDMPFQVQRQRLRRNGFSVNQYTVPPAPDNLGSRLRRRAPEEPSFNHERKSTSVMETARLSSHEAVRQFETVQC